MFKRSLVIAMFVVTSAAFAGPAGGGSVVFDPTNFSKNMVTAAESIEHTRQQIQGNLTKLYQYQEMLRQGKAIAAGDMVATAQVVGGPQLAQTVADTKSMYQALTNLSGGMGDLQGRYAYSMQMAQRYGLTLEQYLKNQAAQSERRVKEAQIQQNANVKAIEHVNATYAAVQSLEEKATTNPTDTALFQILNKNMSVLNTTTAKTLEFMANSSSDEQKRLAGKAGADAQAAADAEKERQAVKDANAALAKAAKADLDAARSQYK